MKFKQIIGRLTGFSVPIFGVSWNPPEPEVQKARRVLTYLEDRRVLYNPDSLEVPEQCPFRYRNTFFLDERDFVDRHKQRTFICIAGNAFGLPQILGQRKRERWRDHSIWIPTWSLGKLALLTSAW